MQPVIDSLSGQPRVAQAAAGVPAASSQSRPLQIRFTGSGSEYFRIWIVNQLLIVVTLGLYLPFAKARRIRYFYANTLVDGHALGFHGDAWKMFRGFLLLAVLMGVYGIAGYFSKKVAFLAFIALCVVWPALWRASMQFRLANTSWRGMRMRFDGGLKQAYLAVAPLYLPLVALVGMPLLVELLTASPGAPDPGARAALVVPGMWELMALVAVSLMVPWFLAATKRYQHNGYRIAGQHAHSTLSTWPVVGLCLKTALVGSAPLALLVLVVGAVGTAMGIGQKGTVVSTWIIMGLAALVLLSYLLWFVAVVPFFTARLQNLVWNTTRSETVVFVSTLRFRDLCGLTLKNWTLVLLTLSLYRPFAVVNTARLRLEAVRVEVGDDVDQWAAPGRTDMQDATGDSAGDFFGIDMGL